MSTSGLPYRKVTTKALAAVFIAALAWGGWLSLRPAPDRRVVIVPELNKPVIFGDLKLKPVDMPVALLFDCYENALENVPPRTDTSKRQWSWEAPPLPMDVARAELTKPGATESDKKVLAWLEDWEFGWKKDYPTTIDQVWRLEPNIKGTSLSFESLFQIGLAMSFLDGDECASLWMKCAISILKTELADIRYGSNRATRSLDSLAQTRSLWQVQDMETLAMRFACERRICQPKSAQSRRAGVLLAERLYHAGAGETLRRFTENLEREQDEAGDLSSEDKVEMHWLLGLFKAYSGDYEGSIKQ
jgi:hypothetical protein